ncbi:MAG TPA: TIGR01906 family membrane protein [Dehalococcoidia bacterium]|nr:TIGR01906 family membrane protein [Dehalococcoidia bacterium]
MAVLRVLATVLFVLSIPVALITSNIRFVANESRVYRYAIDQFDAVRTTGIDRAQLLRAGDEIRAYFNNDEETLSIRVSTGGREENLFTARETLHMQDVKSRLQAMNRVQEFSVVYALVYVVVVVLWAREVSLRGLAVNVALGCVVCLVLLAAVGIVGIAGFDSAWEDFHRLIFSNDFWLLNPASDRLIQMFPPAFWESIVFFIGVMVVAQAALLLLAAGIYLGASRHAEARRLEALYA